MQSNSIKGPDYGNRILANFMNKTIQLFATTKPIGQRPELRLSYEKITDGHGKEVNVEMKVNEGSNLII